MTTTTKPCTCGRGWNKNCPRCGSKMEIVPPTADDRKLAAFSRLQIGTRVHVEMEQRLGNNPHVVAKMGEFRPPTNVFANDVSRGSNARYIAKSDPIVGKYIRDVGEHFAIRVPHVGVVVFRRTRGDDSYISPAEWERGTMDEGVVILVV